MSSGLVETAESRRVREQDEVLRQRMAEGRARVRLHRGVSEEVDREDLSGLTAIEILNRGGSVAATRAVAVEWELQALKTSPGYVFVLAIVTTLPLMQETVSTTAHQEAHLTAREQLEHAKAAYEAAQHNYEQWKHEQRTLFLVPKRNN